MTFTFPLKMKDLRAVSNIFPSESLLTFSTGHHSFSLQYLLRLEIKAFMVGRDLTTDYQYQLITLTHFGR